MADRLALLDCFEGGYPPPYPPVIDAARSDL